MPVTARRKASTIDSCLSIRILHLSHPASGVAHRDPASESPGHLQQDSVVRVIDTGRASVRVAPLASVASAETEEAIGLPGDRKSTRLTSSHSCATRMPSYA